MKKSAPINIIVHAPTSEAGKAELAQRVASVHADMVHHYIQHLDCPSQQKNDLLDAVIRTASESFEQRQNPNQKGNQKTR